MHPEYEAVLYHAGSIVTTTFRSLLYTQLFGPGLIANIRKRTGWSQALFDRVAWEAYGAAFKHQTKFRQISIMKLSHDLWNTGAQKKLFGQEPEGLCPVCSETLETMDHVFQCKAEAAMVIKVELVKEFCE
mmetsp:Transcript_16552/g.23604  ORF Transcript_16552/g.23604 Transcript_16552/m.23604 type:complete len:131 (+) Transcript_16552:1973-2365(+)